MRHGKSFNHLGRQKAHREAMLSNMAVSLIMHKRIKTTVAKAKALKVFVEPLVTKSKEDTTHSRRIVFGYLQSKEAVTELFREVSAKIGDRPGGYTRILKTGARSGDNAEMCVIELVDYNESMLASADTKQKTTRRSRRGTKKATSETTAPAAKVSAKPAGKVTAAATADVVKEAEVVEDVVVEDPVEVVEAENIVVEEPAAEEKTEEVKSEEEKTDDPKEESKDSKE